MLRSLLRPSLMLACVVASGCGPAPESEVLPEQTVTQSLRWPRWIRIVASDIIGGLEGAAAGAEVGTKVGGANGTLIGAAVGAIAYGAQASGETAAQLSTTKGVVAGSVSRIGASNSANPYDYVGRHHNVGLDKMVSIIGPGGCIPNPFPFPPPRDRTRGPLFEYAGAAMKAPAELVKSPELEKGFHDSLDYIATTLDEDLEVSIQKRVKSGKMSQAVGERLVRYFTTVASLDTDKMIEATRSFEKETLADKALLEQERVNLLSAYSVARHSAVYWAEQAARGAASPWASCPIK